MNGGLFAILVVLNILLDMAGWVDGEDVSVASIIIEWVAVDCIGRFLCGKEEDGASFGVGIVCFGYWTLLVVDTL